MKFISTLKRRAALTAVALMAVVASLFVAPSPASAAYSDCPAGWACVWSGTGGTGTRVDMSYSWMLPVASCSAINPGAIGGYKSITTTVGSGYDIYFYSSATCGGANLLGSISFGQTWSSSSGGIRAVIMI